MNGPRKMLRPNWGDNDWRIWLRGNGCSLHFPRQMYFAPAHVDQSDANTAQRDGAQQFAKVTQNYSLCRLPFSIVTRTSSKAWIPELAGSFLTGASLMAWNSRTCVRFMWLPGLRTFRDPNQPSSKSSPRCGCCTIFWSFGKLRHRTRRIQFADQNMWSRKARRRSGAVTTPKRCWIQSQRIRCPAYETWLSSPRCSTASPGSAQY